eukprot:UN02466
MDVLIKQSLEIGLSLYTNTSINNNSYDSDQKINLIETDKGTIRAKKSGVCRRIRTCHCAVLEDYIIPVECDL